MSIGQITLDPINFNVTSKLDGLQGLKGYTVIEGIDVMGGEEQGLDLAVKGLFCSRRVLPPADERQCPSSTRRT